MNATTMPILGYMPVPLDFKYMDAFLKGRPKHEKFDAFWRKHPMMDTGHRAKIFAPFDALKGFDENISSKEVQYADKADLDEGEQRELNHQLSILHGYTFNGRMARVNRIFITVEYFVPCADEYNYAFELGQGRYETAYGMVLNVDEVKETLRLRTEIGEATIDFSDILSITPDNNRLFDEVPDDPW